MRVLFHAYNTCCQTEAGGVNVRIHRIKELLEKSNISVDFFNAYETDLRDYDVLHIFSLQAETARLVSCAKTLGLKVVVSTIVNINKNQEKAIKNSLLFRRILNRLRIFSEVYHKYEVIRLADYLIVETPAEGRFLQKYYKCPENKIRVIPNGVDEQKQTNDVIDSVMPNTPKYVLQIGRIDENKNLLNTIKAVKGANYDLVVVGGLFAVSNSGYYKRCEAEAEGVKNIHFLGWLPPGSKELFSVYKHAHAVVVPSYQETFGLVAVEGAMAGAHVCLSKTLPILEFGAFDPDLTFDPSKPAEIRTVLDSAMSLPKNDIVKNNVKSIFSWPQIIDEHIKIYAYEDTKFAKK